MTVQSGFEGERFYHGCKAALAVGDLLAPGHASNYGDRRVLAHIYFAATLEAAVWGAELAVGDGPGRIYLVEPMGSFEDDPNLTDKRFPGNPTKSYRSRDPLRVVGELHDWPAHPPEQVQAMKDGLAALAREGGGVIED